MIIYFLTNYIAPSELNNSVGVEQATVDFDICSTATIKY